MVVGVMFHDGVVVVVGWSMDDPGDLADPGHWPPPDAVLVAGPGSPWAPMGGAPSEE